MAAQVEACHEALREILQSQKAIYQKSSATCMQRLNEIDSFVMNDSQINNKGLMIEFDDLI